MKIYLETIIAILSYIKEIGVDVFIKDALNILVSSSKTIIKAAS